MHPVLLGVLIGVGTNVVLLAAYIAAGKISDWRRDHRKG